MTVTFESWELPARMALGDQGVRYHEATPIIDHVKDHCLRTGQSPYEAFGEPREFAARAAAQVPAELRDPVDREGMTPRDYLEGQLLVVTGLVIPAVLLIAAIDRTWTFPATAAGLTGSVLLMVTFFWAGAVPRAVRASGRPHLVPYAWVAAALLVLITATAFTTLPRGHLFDLPVLAVAGVAAVVVALQLRGPSPTRPREPQPEGDWFGRLNGLLIGRYDLTPERAAELTREARARGGDLGPVEEYARTVQQGEPVRRDPFWRTRPARVIGILAGIGLAVRAFGDWQADGVWWAAYLIALPGALGGLWFLIQALRGKG
ncbi:hypothetical protein Aab01nite_62840 [Paractinoplanes abujensis]|uniref:Uncharacterized protein n=1 Tax=Paractinoplanes abujensis TaxID=882441 RepID=A0A7W7CQE7_9ACTN|nr:hypothetical protein [Actinoplanes abujensis]MBB4692807.1 hypothetical protein [Actinoplanes abujensis]GID22694.1 hypothetical protein Aab01nite_62840 [Actinoplanes abujensis]